MVATKNINSLNNSQVMGWADCPIARVAAGHVSISGSLSLIDGTLTADKPLLNGTQTWNNAAVAFCADRINVTDTASAAGSLLIDRQVGGVSKFKVSKNGDATLNGVTVSPGSAATPAYQIATGTGIFSRTTGNLEFSLIGSSLLMFDASGIRLKNTAVVSWSSTSNVGSGIDLQLLRDSAGVLALRDGTNAQKLLIAATYTDASNYRRLALASTTGGVFSIKPEGAGTGAAGNVLHISGLPTSNPGPGILWNNAGTPAIGT